MKALADLRLGPGAEFELRHWLSTQLDLQDTGGTMLELFRRASKPGRGPRDFHVCGMRIPGSLTLTGVPDWIVRVKDDWATVRMLPFGQAWRLPLAELLEVIVSYFDERSPGAAAQLRSAGAEDMPELRRPVTAAALIGALAMIGNPSVEAVERVLGTPLPPRRAVDELRDYGVDFTAGAFRRVLFFHNLRGGQATLTLVPRVPSPESLDARELGWSAQFDGFNFERPGEVRRQFRADVGGTAVRIVEAAADDPGPAVLIEWKARHRATPLLACGAPPRGVPRLDALATVRTPSRVWLTMEYDGNAWIPAPPVKLPARVALRVELANLAEFPGVDAHRAARLRLVVDLEARESRRVAGGDALRETLHARVLEVCVDESSSAAVAHLPADLQTALEQPRTFTMTDRLDAIPDSVRQAFAQATGLATFRMAKPGGPWQVTDEIVDRELPGRRLQSVAVSRDWVVVFYEMGGIAHTYHVCVFRLAGNTAQLAWRAMRPMAALDVDGLVRAIRAGEVDDDSRNSF